MDPESAPSPKHAKPKVPKKDLSRSARSKASGRRHPPGFPPDLRSKERMPTAGRPRKWDRKKLVAYVCARYAEGELLIDICKRIGITRSFFFGVRNTTEEYRNLWEAAVRASAAAQQDYVRLVSEGRDRITIAKKKQLDELIADLAKGKKRTKYGKVFGFGLVQELEKSLRARNALQIDAAKWYAKTADPSTFGDRVDHTVSPGDAPLTIKIEFVAPSAPAPKEPTK